MRERKFKKLVQEYPFLLDDAFQLSRTDAKKLYAQGFPSAQEIIAGAKKKYSHVPSEAWKVYDDVLVAQSVSISKNTLTGKRVVSFARRHPKLIAACLIVALLFSFFTLVPAGRALAAEVVRFIANVFGNRIEITSVEPSTTYDSETEEFYYEYSSFEELGDVGVMPFILTADGLDLDSVTYEGDFVWKRLFATYVLQDGRYIYASQIWDMEVDSSTTFNGEEYEVMQLSNGRTLYVSVDTVNGWVQGQMLTHDSYIVISVPDKSLLSEMGIG
ncbi:hypothetical protein LJC07_07490 [Christensenellaceae bacterium OttesenSCG-928-L17]|nr:hypothetical protein [Christensenellaceae bacterium OttesenSCG-928-L17]